MRTSAGTYVEQVNLCNGVNNAASRICQVSMASFRASPFNLLFDNYINVKVKARNERGWSIASDPNADTTQVQVEPEEMVIPTRGDATGPSQIEVKWLALTSHQKTGGSAITSYHLQRQNLTTQQWVDVVGFSPASLALSFIVS